MLNVPVLIDNIIAEIPDDYERKSKIIIELDFVKKSAPYRAPECLFLSTDDIHLILNTYILKFFDKENYPEWVDNVLAVYWEGVSLL